MRNLLYVVLLILSACGGKNESYKEITEADFGNEWPFTVDKGILVCVQYEEIEGLNPESMRGIIFTVGSTQYAINGTATSRAEELGYQSVIDIVKPDTLIGGTYKMSIGPIIEEGLKICQ
jgi:hypothetical protein